jgi:sigma-B regulation protein RsbU (phosphoserine phosphatase)
MIAIVAGVTAFFLVDAYSRKHIIPQFFPQGRLSDTPVRIKVSIIRRIRVLFGLGTNAPMLLLVGTIGFGVWQIGRVSAQAAAFGREILVFAVVVWIIFICLALSLNFLVSSSISHPIREMLGLVGKIKKGNYQHRVPVVTNDELGVLGDGMNEMTEGLQEREHLRRSLILAKEIQQALLPDDDPRVPGLDIAGSSIYCEDTGGDYYDYLLPADASDHSIGIVLGDVSGHGISSALLMATSRGFLRQRAALPGTIEETVADVNQQLIRDVVESGSFITMFYLKIDVGGRRLSWVRAGHDPALLYDPVNNSFAELSGMGTVLGVDPDAVYREYHQADLSAGQIIVLGTDGIWEAQDPDGEMFGKKRLEQVVKRYRAAGARDIMLAILSAVDDFQKGRPAEDDITLVVIKLLEEPQDS